MTTEAAAPRCAVCGARAARRTVYHLPAFDVVRCGNCGAMQRDPLPSAAEMESYYRDPSYIQGGYFAGDSPSHAQSPETAIFQQALAFLEARRRRLGLAAAGRLLDVGAGSGKFLDLARARGWQADGVELSPELAERAEARSGATVVRGDFPVVSLPAGAYDAVTMWDVLEHTVDPGSFLERARALLAPQAMLVVFTIDAASLFNIVADLAWRLSLHRVQAPLELLYDKRHNHYFTGKTLAMLLARHRMRVEHAETHRAHLGRWLSEPASRLVLAGAEAIDLLSVPLGRPYRQLLYCVPA